MKYNWLYFLLISQLLISCGSLKNSYQYDIVNMTGTIIEMNKEQGVNQDMQAFVDKYKGTLDKEMNEVIGESSEFMQKGRPESLLTNFTSDVMRKYGDKHFLRGADVALMNVNGHRASMPKGKITLGNLYEIYSFDNAITFLELKGEDLTKIFEAYARIGGAGISSNAHLAVKNRELISATLDGKIIDNSKIYNIVTIDYLADGNDNMNALRNSVKIDHTGITLRDIMINYVREQTAKDKLITSKIDGRITIE